jgi:hypothetical protein
MSLPVQGLNSPISFRWGGLLAVQRRTPSPRAGLGIAVLQPTRSVGSPNIVIYVRYKRAAPILSLLS